MTVWTETPTLAGRHVRLRPLDPADVDALVEVARAGDLWDLFYANVSMLKTPERWLAAVMRERDYGRALPFTVETPDGQVVGATRLMRLAPAHRRLEIGGTFYAKAVQRTGVNTEAKRMLLAHAFDQWQVNRVALRCDARNERSARAIERLGATREGRLRRHRIAPDGSVSDTLYFSILREEWPAVRAGLEGRLGG